MSTIRYISLFSGIEAATVAWHQLGWKPIAYAEIEPFPKAVLRQHYPEVPDLGDMTKVNGSQAHPVGMRAAPGIPGRVDGYPMERQKAFAGWATLQGVGKFNGRSGHALDRRGDSTR